MENPNFQQIPPPSQFPPPMYVTQSSTLAIVSLITGILGWIGFIGIGPIIAIITGHMARNEINKSGGRITGSGMATAGLVLGYINLGLSIIGLCIFLAFLVLGLGSPLLCLPFVNQIH
jgi:hypothetical protein